MAYTDQLKTIQQRLETNTGYSALLDMYITTKQPPVWFVLFDGMDFSQPAKETKLMVRVIAVGGYVDKRGSFEKCADMADKSIETFKSLGFKVKATGIYSFMWGGKAVRAFDVTFQYGED